MLSWADVFGSPLAWQCDTPSLCRLAGVAPELAVPDWLSWHAQACVDACDAVRADPASVASVGVFLTGAVTPATAARDGWTLEAGLRSAAHAAAGGAEVPLSEGSASPQQVAIGLAQALVLWCYALPQGLLPADQLTALGRKLSGSAASSEAWPPLGPVALSGGAEDDVCAAALQLVSSLPLREQNVLVTVLRAAAALARLPATPGISPSPLVAVADLVAPTLTRPVSAAGGTSSWNALPPATSALLRSLPLVHSTTSSGVVGTGAGEGDGSAGRPPTPPSHAMPALPLGPPASTSTHPSGPLSSRGTGPTSARSRSDSVASTSSTSSVGAAVLSGASGVGSSLTSFLPAGVVSSLMRLVPGGGGGGGSGSSNGDAPVAAPAGDGMSSSTVVVHAHATVHDVLNGARARLPIAVVNSWAWGALALLLASDVVLAATEALWDLARGQLAATVSTVLTSHVLGNSPADAHDAHHVLALRALFETCMDGIAAALPAEGEASAAFSLRHPVWATAGFASDSPLADLATGPWRLDDSTAPVTGWAARWPRRRAGVCGLHGALYTARADPTAFLHLLRRNVSAAPTTGAAPTPASLWYPWASVSMAATGGVWAACGLLQEGEVEGAGGALFHPTALAHSHPLLWRSMWRWDGVVSARDDPDWTRPSVTLMHLSAVATWAVDALWSGVGGIGATSVISSGDGGGSEQPTLVGALAARGSADAAYIGGGGTGSRTGTQTGRAGDGSTSGDTRDAATVSISSSGSAVTGGEGDVSSDGTGFLAWGGSERNDAWGIGVSLTQLPTVVDAVLQTVLSPRLLPILLPWAAPPPSHTGAVGRGGGRHDALATPPSSSHVPARVFHAMVAAVVQESAPAVHRAVAAAATSSSQRTPVMSALTRLTAAPQSQPQPHPHPHPRRSATVGAMVVGEPTAAGLAASPATPAPPLPTMEGASDIMSAAQAGAVAMWLPPTHRDAVWRCVYSLARHGALLDTLVARCNPLSAGAGGVTTGISVPCITVVKDEGGCVFGAFTPEPWAARHSGRGYYGTGQTAVFTFRDPADPAVTEFHATRAATFADSLAEGDTLDAPRPLMVGGVVGGHLYRWTRINRYFQMVGLGEGLAVGGGGSFAFHLSPDLARGHTGTCATFASPPLCPSPSGMFEVLRVEVWALLRRSQV